MAVLYHYIISNLAPSQKRMSLIPLDVFALHIYSEPNFCMDCVYTGLLPHISIPEEILFQQ